MQELFDDAELAITRLERHELDIEASEVPFDAARIPTATWQMISSDPEARTYQFVIEAVPVTQPGMRELQRHVSQQAEALAASAARVRELEDARDAREHHIRELEEAREHRIRKLEDVRDAREHRIRELEQAIAGFAAREGELRRSVVEAHDRLLQRDEALVRLDAEVVSLRARAREAEHLEAQLGAALEEARRLRVRLERILASPPFRIYHRAQGAPVLRRLSARRQARYDAALEHSRRAAGG